MNSVGNRESIITSLIQFEEGKLGNNSTDKDMCLSFSGSYKDFYEQFKIALLELRDTYLNCITSDVLNLKINNFSKFFPGKEILLLDVIKLLVFYKIDEQNSIRFLFERLEYYKNFPKNDKRKYDFAFEIFIVELFSKEFKLYDGELDSCIENYISPVDIKDISTACLYYNVIKNLHSNYVELIPGKVLKVAAIIEAIGIIDGDGLGSLYFSFQKDYIKNLVGMMFDVGLDEIGNIILHGLEFTEEYNELEKLQSKIYKIEKGCFIDDLLESYLRR